MFPVPYAGAGECVPCEEATTPCKADKGKTAQARISIGISRKGCSNVPDVVASVRVISFDNDLGGTVRSFDFGVINLSGCGVTVVNAAGGVEFTFYKNPQGGFFRNSLVLSLIAPSGYSITSFGVIQVFGSGATPVASGSNFVNVTAAMFGIT